ncbi:hypothetical protein GCM10011349_13900 [Novosphingobium indicum]|uniref:Uncharacterized protein n=2 Tax=Novosphingobium indicum TaxID=462949 RepID=A0ABQ2JJ72_9SPHN|nr:hypothetical protein GCM10011349_13900 [Novosphingobium indicum]
MEAGGIALASADDGAASNKGRTPCRSKSVVSRAPCLSRVRDGDGAGGKSAGGPIREAPHPQERGCKARGTECGNLDRAAQLCRSRRMEFDDQMRRFFGTEDLGNVSADAMASGIERMQVEFGLEADKGRRFAMWSLLYMLGSAPDLDAAFADAGDRDAARRFMDLLDQANAGEES